MIYQLHTVSIILEEKVNKEEMKSSFNPRSFCVVFDMHSLHGTIKICGDQQAVMAWKAKKICKDSLCWPPNILFGFHNLQET